MKELSTKIIIFIVIGIAWIALSTIISTWLWNYFALMFNLPTFTYWQMFGFTVLLELLFSKINIKIED